MISKHKPNRPVLLACLLISLFISRHPVLGQNALKYQIDLRDHKENQVAVHLTLPTTFAQQSSINFEFPKTIPGTYAAYDYGRFVKNFQAFDSNGNELKVKKKKPNSFIVMEQGLSNITYTYHSTWEKLTSPYIFPPAGCSFMPEDYAVINGGMFAYPEGNVDKPYEISLLLPDGMEAYSGAQEIKSGPQTLLKLKDYHQVIDHPILVTSQPAAYVQVANTKVTVASHTPFDSSSYKISVVMEDVMKAIEKFVGQTPVNEYDYLIYFTDSYKARRIMDKMVEDGKNGPIRTIRVIAAIGAKVLLGGAGALEHGTSSMYYLPGLLEDGHENALPDIAIHEFMHIYAPLTVHSNYIGNFDYKDPRMSKHLWLYEGVTEYFAELIQLQGSLVSLPVSLNENFRRKISAGEKWPKKMSFTEMSEKVFEKPFKKQYTQVYTRGAILAMLLDFEIMNLTNGQKTLKDVIFKLSETYGASKSIPEDSLIDIFVGEVHPELIHFFEDYIIGTKEWDIEGGYAKVGIRYQRTAEEAMPADLWGDANIQIEDYFFDLAKKKRVIKVKDSTQTPLREGDIIIFDDQIKAFPFDLQTGRYLAEGSEIKLDVLRNGEIQKIPFAISYKKKTKWRVTVPIEKAEMTEKQARLFELWTKGRTSSE